MPGSSTHSNRRSATALRSASPESNVRQRTRRALVEAAVQVFAEKGVDGAALHEIAARAGVSNGTFYNYFRTREELVAAARRLLARCFIDEIGAAYSGVADPVERLSIGCRAFLLRARRDATWGAAVLHVWGTSNGGSDRAIEPVLEDLRAARRARRLAYRDERAAADLVQGAVIAGMRSLLDPRVDASHVQHVVVLVLRGLGLDDREARALVRKPLPAGLRLPGDAP